MPKNAGNLIFELQFLKIFWGGMPPDPPGASAFGTCNRTPSAPSMLKYKSPPFSLGFPVFQSPSTSFTKARVGSHAMYNMANKQFIPIVRCESLHWNNVSTVE